MIEQIVEAIGKRAKDAEDAIGGDTADLEDALGAVLEAVKLGVQWCKAKKAGSLTGIGQMKLPFGEQDGLTVTPLAPRRGGE